MIADTAGRLPTQLHLMEELQDPPGDRKAEASAPHEVLLVVDGNTGQNALAQVKAFDDALLQLTGLIVTKLDGTAKGGVLAAIARERPVPVYFIGVGEKLGDLQTFDAREFARACCSTDRPRLSDATAAADRAPVRRTARWAPVPSPSA